MYGTKTRITHIIRLVIRLSSLRHNTPCCCCCWRWYRGCRKHCDCGKDLTEPLQQTNISQTVRRVKYQTLAAVHCPRLQQWSTESTAAARAYVRACVPSVASDNEIQSKTFHMHMWCWFTSFHDQCFACFSPLAASQHPNYIVTSPSIFPSFASYENRATGNFFQCRTIRLVTYLRSFARHTCAHALRPQVKLRYSTNLKWIQTNLEASGHVGVRLLISKFTVIIFIFSTSLCGRQCEIRQDKPRSLACLYCVCNTPCCCCFPMVNV